MTIPRQTKIVATLGPSSSDPTVIRELIISGVNVCRLNFSHGDHNSHQQLIENIRAIAKKLKKPVAILQDLCGPKIRVAKLPNDADFTLVAGRDVVLIPDQESPLKANQIAISLSTIAEDVQVGEPIRLDDGKLHIQVKSVDREKKEVTCDVLHGGVLKMKKGVNFPKTNLSVPSITTKDIADLKFGLSQDVDFVALSFVRHEDDIKELRRYITEANKQVKVISKIEKGEAIERSRQIILESDGIMVARGDLGVEFPIHEVPAIQKDLIRQAVLLDRFVITATQMLESMTTSPLPTRAEVSDVANAIYDGTDAIMLSGETASGDYPIQTVKMMATIAQSADQEIFLNNHGVKLYSELDQTSFADALCHAAYTLSKDTAAKHVIAYTNTGRTPLFMSRYRPCPNIIGATTVLRVYRQLSILRAVQPLYIPEVETVHELTVVTEQSILDNKLGDKEDVVIHVGGSNLAARSNINSIRIRTLLDD
ncbi:MAG: pyruvate kinase [Planctomycetota bacterium]|nr:pyruvate kinase [Planctomycetota bacterium]